VQSNLFMWDVKKQSKTSHLLWVNHFSLSAQILLIALLLGVFLKFSWRYAS